MKPLDPTENVIALSKAMAQRTDDLRKAESRRIDGVIKLQAFYIAKLEAAEIRRASEVNALQHELSRAEHRRFDDLRAFDVAAIKTSTEQATEQATALAKQVIDQAEVQRKLVESTALTMAALREHDTTLFNERLAATERAQMLQAGASGGKKDFYGWLVAAIIALVAVANFVVPRLE